MAATDKPYRNQKTLDIVFAVSCILMLLSVVWMLVADYNREFKAVQRTFRDVESVLNERQMLAALPDPADVEAVRKAVAEATKAVDDVKAKVHPDDQRITAELDLATADYRSDKADLDSLSSLLDIAGTERDQAGISREVRRERTERYEALNKTVEDKRNKVAEDQNKVDKISAEYKSKVTEPVARAQNDLADAQDALKKATANFDRFAKQTVQKEWGFGDAFRSLPILDAFESPTKIKQIVLADLPIEYGSFKYVTRYDRCASCHLAVDRVGFDHRTLTKLTRGENEAREARRAAVKAAVNDVISAVGAAMPKDDQAKLVALESAVDKGDVVTKIEARAPNAASPPPVTPEATSGTATRVEKDKITVQAGDGKETTFAVPADPRVLIDGVADKLENVQPGSLVTVVKGDDAKPFEEIAAVLRDLRDPTANTFDPGVREALKDPLLDADLVRVKEEDEDFREAQSLPKKLETARRILQERKDKGENLGFEPGDLPSHARTVALMPGQVTQFATHPRLDLFVDSNSPHPMEKFGCTICHAGQGSATDFQLSAHSPADSRQQKQWEDAYHWHATHDWEFPMLSDRFTESSCLKCHHEVTDLVRQGNKEEAPKLLRGFNLVRENGCFGCHEIAGIKSGREVGPDLRLEPQPALEWLSPTDQDKAKADPTNPPGTYRKVGPSLRRIAEKTNEEWARRWIQSPRGFRPDTKMPHFYNLSNDTPGGPGVAPDDALPDDQKDFPAAEIHSIAHYLFAESKAHLNGADTYRLALEERIKKLQDQLQYSPLEEKDRKDLADATHKLADLALLSAPPRAAKINELAAGLREAQDRLLERYPKLADLEVRIAELEKKTGQNAEADVAKAATEDLDQKALEDLKKDIDALDKKFDDQKKELGAAADKLPQDFGGLKKAVGDATKELADGRKELGDRADESVKLTRKYLTAITPKEAAELIGLEAAKKYLTGLTPDEIAKLADELKNENQLEPVNDRREKAFKDLLDRATPLLQKRIELRQKVVDLLNKTLGPLTREAADRQKALDAAKKATADAQLRVAQAAAGLPATLGASTGGFLASDLESGPLLAALALYPGRPAADEKALDEAKKDVEKVKKEQDEKQKDLDTAKKELDDRTKEVKKQLEQPTKELNRAQNEKKEVDQAKDDRTRLSTEREKLGQDMDASRKDLGSRADGLEEVGRATPMAKQLFDAEGEPADPEKLPPPGDKTRLAEGHRLFSERGCLACHVHNGVRPRVGEPADKTQADDGVYYVPEAAANFAPDLSRVAFKIAPRTGDAKEDAAARRRWVVQWVLNPNIYHPRTRMPITHLTVQQACDVADWLLSQEVKPEELANWKDPEAPAPEALLKLAKLYLAKAPGMTSAKVDEILPDSAVDPNKNDDDPVAGLSPNDYANTAHDADEASLVDTSGGAPERIRKKDLTAKLEWYVGKKAIGRLGCYGCHDMPGFETAKPIGTALNDWGKKDPERLAFEDGDAYVRDHYHLVDARDDAGNKYRPNPDFHSAAGKEPYEQAFSDALEHHTREGFLHQKLTEPRSFDYHRVRAWDDRLRMPQFRFARSRPRPGEAEEAYQARQEREEAEAREAVMTFILGLVAEPIPPKYVNTPGPDRLAEAQGRKVLEKFNCVGCHQVRPGVYEFKPTKSSLEALERAYQNYSTGKSAQSDHVFPGHNAWTGLASPWPDRLVAYGTQAHAQADETTGRDALSVRLAQALHFANNDRVERDVPAGEQVNLPPEDVFSASPPLGGAFGDLLIPYLMQQKSPDFDTPDKARSGLPPPLVREGERVQPKWLYQFLLDPKPVRPQGYMKLRMPKFNMSGEEATALVNYFGAADRLSNPGAGLTFPYLSVPQTDEKFWRDRTEDYLKSVKADARKPEERAASVVQTLTKALQDNLDAATNAAKDLKGDELAKKQQEIDNLKKQIQVVQNWSGELAQESTSPDAYAADAYRLVANPAICMNCHSVGAATIQGAKGPDLRLSAERLRPEWTLQWIGNPKRMFAYDTIMPQNFPNDEKTNYNNYFVGQPIDRVRAARDVLMDLPRLETLDANRKTQAVITGGK